MYVTTRTAGFSTTCSTKSQMKRAYLEFTATFGICTKTVTTQWLANICIDYVSKVITMLVLAFFSLKHNNEKPKRTKNVPLFRYRVIKTLALISFSEMLRYG